MINLVREGWVVITPTLCQGDTMAWSTENDEEEAIPIVFDTEEEAWKEIAEDMINQLQQFVDGERELEDTNFGTEEYVAQYKEFDDGVIIVYNNEENILRTTLKEWRENL